MIRWIGVISEDAHSYGFLRGLRDRLRCEAEFIPPPAAIGRTTHLTKKTARQAWRHFLGKGADLVVRFVDADGDAWRDVQRREGSKFPDEASSMCLVGVAVEEIEDWLCIDPVWLAEQLDIELTELRDARSRNNRIKKAIAKKTDGRRDKSEVVARLVRECPDQVFKKWLKTDKALRAFYDACRQAAKRASCETPNESDAD